MNIDGALEDKPGVLSADTSYARATTKVTYDTSKITEAELKQVIKELGYTAQAT